jgi:hypothetical protein
MHVRGLVTACCSTGAIAAAALFLASPAFAATVERDDVDSADVSDLAVPRETNRIVVREEANGIRFIDSGAILSTRACTLVNPP